FINFIYPMVAVRHILVFLGIVIPCHFFNAQINQFQITFGNNQSNWGNAIPTSDGGYLVVSEDSAFTALRDIMLIKTDTIGDTVWVRRYGNAGNTDDTWDRILEAHNGGYILWGALNTNTTSSISVWIRVDSNGDTVWVKRDLFGNGDFIKTGDGGYASVGTSMLKSDSSGNIQWAKLYNGAAGFSFGQQTMDGGYIILSNTAQFASGGPLDRDLVLIRTDSAGTIIWSRVYGRPNTIDDAAKVVQSTDGGFAILATTGTLSQNQTNELLVIKTDASGNLQWSKTYGGPNYDQAIDMKVTGAIGYIVTGYTLGFEGPVQNSTRSFLLRIDGNGNALWSKMYGDMATNNINSHDYAAYVKYTNDGGFLMAGSTESFGSGQLDTWLVKTNAMGVSGCNEIANFPTVLIPTLVVDTPGITDSAVFYTSMPYTINVGSWQPARTILCLNGFIPSNGIDEEDKDGFLLYPNPGTGIFTLSSEQIIEEVIVVDILGKELIRLPAGSSSLEIDISNRPPGIYFLQIGTENGTLSRKIIKL
ncbi:MAG: T9SS type A sorting domain-containing protein, partial [Bacteroidota bacterium]